MPIEAFDQSGAPAGSAAVPKAALTLLKAVSRPDVMMDVGRRTPPGKAIPMSAGNGLDEAYRVDCPLSLTSGAAA